ncbi:Protein FATTY ACID EXPORT 1, chloroplastic [Linum perenne]
MATAATTTATTTTTTTTSTGLSQLSCFSSINRNLHQQLHFLHSRRPFSSSSSPRLPKMSIVMRVERPNTGAAKPDPYMGYESTSKSLPYGEESNLDESKKIEYGKDGGVYGSAMIHDFCFGIPFGGLVLSGGLIGLLFSRSTATFSGLLIGGGLLALSSYSLKIWRQGKSSLPFVFGQAVLAAALLWKNIEAYSLTKSLLPAGIFATISAAMLCFYIHVMVSGGNPPPKKLHSSTSRT